MTDMPQPGRTVRIDEMSWPEFAAAVKRFPTAVVPFGAIEPHGRHAPLGTDPYIAEEIAMRLGRATGSLVHPFVPVGSMDTLYRFLDFPGAISIDAQLVTGLAVNIGRELARNGVKRIIFVNGHGPNSPALALAAFQINSRADIEVGVLEWWTAASQVISEIKGFTYGTHADEIETSLVLATAHGDHVDLDQAVRNSPTLEEVDALERDLYKRKIVFTRELDARYVGQSGNMGDPARASAEKGDRIIEATVEVGKQLIELFLRREGHLSSGS